MLVDAARPRATAKRGRGATRADLDPDQLPAPGPDDDLLALDEALGRLAARDPVKAGLVKLRHFAGLTADQAAAALGLSPSTADWYWAYAQPWLAREVGGRPG